MSAHLHSGRHVSARAGGLVGVLGSMGRGIHVLLTLAGLGAVAWITVMYVRSALQREPAPLPSTMEVVDWSSPESSVYCLACHKTLGPARASLDVEHGHPINVPLSDAQLSAVSELGTIVGPDRTLICTTCHVLNHDQAGGKPYMLADGVSGSRLCAHCHPEQFAQRDTKHDLRVSAPHEVNRLGQTAEEGGPCSACHLAHHYAREFEPCDFDPDGRCITCHATHGCAEELARREMDHPETRCAECHNPHDMRYTHYLKADINTLCTSCHEGLADGQAAGMHPTGPVERPVPDPFVQAGAVLPNGTSELNCVVCHETHTAVGRPLLRVSAESNDVCRLCHENEQFSHFADGVAIRHVQRPVLDEAQFGATNAWNAPIGESGELLCISCHTAHKAHPGTPLLTFAAGDDACIACHPSQGSVIGTAHDLRTRLPDEINVAGIAVRDGGACSACHLGHGPARRLTPAPGDSLGLCTTCHQPESCGEAKLAGAVSHPETDCTDCHDPHQRHVRAFLAKPSPQLCADCHADKFALVGGPHDVLADAAGWPDEARQAGDQCLACHYAHGGPRPDLHRFGAAAGDSYHDDACLTCHADAGWGADSKIAIIHPHEISPAQHKVALALVPKDDTGRMRMGCRTCHDPHGGAEPVHLARVEPGAPTEDLCLHCHDHGHILMSGHSSTSLSRIGRDVDSCKPCHAMHAERDDAWGQMLSPRFLMKEGRSLSEESQGYLPCLACHHTGGPAPLREVYTHPPVVLPNPIERDAPGYLPLFNEAGHVDPAGGITCRTCHLAHGWVPPGKDPAAEIAGLSPEEQRARRFSLRPFTTPNMCTTCHGIEGRWRYLFFHNPDRRKGGS